MTAATALDGILLDLVLTAMSDLEDDREVWPRVFAELSAGLGVTVGGVLDIDRPTLAANPVAVWPAWVATVRVTPEENRGYPLVRHFGRTRDPAPRTLGDVLDEQCWRTDARFDRMRRKLAGADQHLGIPLRLTASTARLVAVGRPDHDFTPDEREYAIRLQQVLTALDRHQRVLAAWRASWTPAAPAPADVVGAYRITPRELAVLSLFAEGLSVVAAGRRLGISPRTVAKHQENLQRKLATPDRLNTVLRAQRLGLLPGPRQGGESGGGSHSNSPHRF